MPLAILLVSSCTTDAADANGHDLRVGCAAEQIVEVVVAAAGELEAVAGEDAGVFRCHARDSSARRAPTLIVRIVRRLVVDEVALQIEPHLVGEVRGKVT